MAMLTLGRHEPRAVDRQDMMTPILLGGLVATMVAAVLHVVLVAQVPWWSPYLGALVGAGMLEFMAYQMWGQQVSGLFVAQIVLIVLTVAIFFSQALVSAFVGSVAVAWAVVCGLRERPGVAVASWLAVGPSLALAAIIAQWLVGRLLTVVERDPLTGAANLEPNLMTPRVR